MEDQRVTKFGVLTMHILEIGVTFMYKKLSSTEKSLTKSGKCQGHFIGVLDISYKKSTTTLFFWLSGIQSGVW